LVLGIYTSANMVPRNFALGLTSDADIQLYTLVTSADNSSFITFPTLVLLGAFWRRRPEIHRRLMLLASLSIVGPAVARIASWYGPIPNLVIPVFVVGFFACMLAHDIWARKRPHLATVLGIAFMVVVGAGMRIAGVGETLVKERIERIQAESVQPQR
jgi:hypothetical protein